MVTPNAVSVPRHESKGIAIFTLPQAVPRSVPKTVGLGSISQVPDYDALTFDMHVDRLPHFLALACTDGLRDACFRRHRQSPTGLTASPRVATDAVLPASATSLDQTTLSGVSAGSLPTTSSSAAEP